MGQQNRIHFDWNLIKTQLESFLCCVNIILFQSPLPIRTRLFVLNWNYSEKDTHHVAHDWRFMFLCLANACVWVIFLYPKRIPLSERHSNVLWNQTPIERIYAERDKGIYGSRLDSSEYWVWNVASQKRYCTGFVILCYRIELNAV